MSCNFTACDKTSPFVRGKSLELTKAVLDTVKPKVHILKSFGLLPILAVCSSTQSSTSPEASQPSNTGFAQLLYEVPHVTDVLCPRSRAAVSACSTQLRTMMHSITTIITVTDSSDVELIAEGNWLCLSLIILPKSSSWNSSPFWTQHSNQDLLSVLVMWQSNTHATAFVVASKPSSGQQRSRAVHAYQQVKSTLRQQPLTTLWQWISEHSKSSTYRQHSLRSSCSPLPTQHQSLKQAFQYFSASEWHQTVNWSCRPISCGHPA